MPIRVLRLIEIEYPDYEAFEENVPHWALPANGVHSFDSRGETVYRTSMLMPHEVFPEPKPAPKHMYILRHEDGSTHMVWENCAICDQIRKLPADALPFIELLPIEA